MKVSVWYHVYADGEWRRPVDEFLAALEEGGLVGFNDCVINVGIVGTAFHRQAVTGYLRERGIAAVIISSNATGYEQRTLTPLHRAAVAMTEETAVLYAHTKGAANPSPFNTAWRQAMTFWCVRHWEIATAALEDNDLVGCHYIDGLPGQPKYFGGNFWWARSSVIAQLDPPLQKTRYDAEVWIGSAQFKLPELRVMDLWPERIGTLPRANTGRAQ